MKQIDDIDQQIDEARQRLGHLEEIRAKLLEAMDRLGKCRFKPENAGFRLVQIHAFDKMAVYHHDTFRLQQGNLALQYFWDKETSERYRLSSFFFGEQFGSPSQEIYVGNIISKRHFHAVVDEMVKWKLCGDEVVECKTQSDRQRIIDVYLTLKVPPEYMQDFSRGYDTKSFPNFRWVYSRPEQRAYWEPESIKRGNSYLQAIGDISRLPFGVKWNVLSVDEFVRRLKNHERGD